MNLDGVQICAIRLVQQEEPLGSGEVPVRALTLTMPRMGGDDRHDLLVPQVSDDVRMVVGTPAEEVHDLNPGMLQPDLLDQHGQHGSVIVLLVRRQHHAEGIAIAPVHQRVGHNAFGYMRAGDRQHGAGGASPLEGTMVDASGQPGDRLDDGIVNKALVVDETILESSDELVRGYPPAESAELPERRAADETVGQGLVECHAQAILQQHDPPEFSGMAVLV